MCDDRVAYFLSTSITVLLTRHSYNLLQIHLTLCERVVKRITEMIAQYEFT